MEKLLGELTYDLPGARGGHRSEPIFFDIPQPELDDDGNTLPKASEAYTLAQAQLEDRLVVLRDDSEATNIRLRSDELVLQSVV